MATRSIARVLLEAKQWHELRQKDELTGDQCLRKGYIAEEVEVLKQDDGAESRDVRFTISTESVDRDRDTVASKGWNFEDFQKNPVVLSAHDHRNPAATASESSRGIGALDCNPRRT